MNIAYCIICHKFTIPLEKNVDILSKDNDIFIHVDNKSDIKNFDKIKDKVTFIKNRVDVRWGAFSQIQATINLLEETKIKKYDYIFLLSGDCLALKNSDEIKLLLSKLKGKQFVARDFNISKEEIELRLKYNYRKINYKKTKSIFETYLERLQYKFKLFEKNKLFSSLPELYKGTNWFGITDDLRDYILNYIEENQKYVEAFKKSLCGDEVFFHTIIFNSKYKDNIYNPNDKSNICYQALRYIDWESGPEYPKVLNSDDFDLIKKTECLFARKFDDNLDVDMFMKKFIM